ncbi:hypothetical protein ACHAQA_004406 [Verticillium albo-atrum]
MSNQQPYYGQPGPHGAPPQGGAPPSGYPQQPPYPQQPQQPYYGYPQQGQPPAAPYQAGPGGPPPPGQPGQPGQQYPNQGYPPQQQQPPQQQPYYGQQQPPPGQPPQAPYGQQQPPYGAPPPQQGYGQYQQQPPYGQPPQQQQQPPYGGAPPAQQQWGQPPPGAAPYAAYNVQPTPASAGYDPAQKAWVQPVDTSADIEVVRKAMKGMGCDEKALIKTFTSPKYANPWAMAQLVRDYNSRFIRDLAKDIESETRGDLETTLLALLRGPLENDARILNKALNRMGTDEDALNDVLLNRSNADLRAIVVEYKRVNNRDLLTDIKNDVDDTLFRLYSMVLASTRAEDATPVNPAEIDAKVTELQRATEGTIGANAVSVAQVLTSSSPSQIHAMTEAYSRKYHRSMQEVIEKEFRGDMEDALLGLVQAAQDRARSDASRLRDPLFKSKRKDTLFINRVVALYWDRSRLEAAKVAYKAKFGRTLAKDVKEALSGDYENVILALIGEK